MRAISIAAIAATAIPAAGDARTLSADIAPAAMRGQIAIAGVQASAAQAAGVVAVVVGSVGVAGAGEAADADNTTRAQAEEGSNFNAIYTKNRASHRHRPVNSVANTDVAGLGRSGATAKDFQFP